MEVSSIPSEDPFDTYKAVDPGPQTWEKIGDVALTGFFLVAISAFIPALAKKKRIYSTAVPLPQAPQLDAVAEVEIEAPQHPVPHCTAEEKRKIEEIFTTTAKGGISLITSGMHLIRLGNEIDHVHPFSFLLAVPKESIRKIFHVGNGFTKSKVIGGIIKGMERDYASLNRYALSFANEMGKDPKQIKLSIRTRNWKQLVRYLFDLRTDALQDE